MSKRFRERTTDYAFVDMRIQRSKPLLAVSVIALFVATSDAYAQTTFEYSLGSLSGDYFGRSEQVGHTAFNGLTLNASGSSEQLDYSLTLAAQLESPSDEVPEFGLGIRFAQDTWKVGLGKEPRHWSPSQYTSLILSRNAENIPAIYLRKTEATKSNSKFISWIGKFKGEFFVGQTNDSLNGDYAVFIGNQFVLQPIENLEIELVRTIQLGGSGQDTDADTLMRALVGDTNEGTAGGVNQVAGAGISYTFDRFSAPIRVYGQLVGEDEAGGLPTCLIDLAGLETVTSLFGASSTFTLESVDTRTSDSTNGFCGRNAAYNNGTYRYTNSGKVLGAAIDTASNAVSLRAKHDFSSWSLNWGVGYHNINNPGTLNHRLSSNNVEGILASVGTGFELNKGKVDAVVAYQGFDLDNAEFADGFYFGINYSGSF